MKVVVAGLGNIGLPVAQHIAKYFDVVGYDIFPKAVERARGVGINSSLEMPPDGDAYVITVGTWFNNDAPDMSAVDSVCSRIPPDALVCLESTLAVGTARRMAEKYGLKYVVVCPHRWWKDDTVHHGVVQTRCFGALNPESKERGMNFYNAIKIPLVKDNGLEMAELAKITENTHRYVQIAFAEQVFLIVKNMVANKIDVSFEKLQEACNSKWNCEILDVKEGIGRECLPKDIQLLAMLGSDVPVLDGAIKTDRKYRESLKKS